MSKRKVAEVLWLALQCAKCDRQGLVNAYQGDTSDWAVKKALADIRAFEALQMRLFGRTENEIDKAMTKMKLVNILELIAGGSMIEVPDIEEMAEH
jgi:hypothetical protein